MLKKLPLATIILLLLIGCASAQITGGQSTFAFLQLSPSARVSALGGNLITVRDDDVNLAYANPALLNSAMHQQIGFSHGFLPAGIQYGYVSYGHALKSIRSTMHAGVQYVQYGDIEARNENNELEGSFKAAEYAIVAGLGFEAYDRLTVGANLKFITSTLSSYNSIGLTTDLAAAYFDTSGRSVITLLVKNIGSQISTYSPDNFESIPFEIQLGLSRRLQYLPFRVSIIYQHFQQWDITYDDPNTVEEDNLFGDANPTPSDAGVFFDNLFRHFIFNGEFLLGKKENLRLRIGYNHLLRKEMSVDGYRSLAGFTFGAGLKINRFRIDYGRTNYHLGGGLHHISISTNLREFRR